MELEARRRLAVTRALQGWKMTDVDAFLGAPTRAVGKWIVARRARCDDGLKVKPHPGAKPKLSPRSSHG